jgi:fructoselysine/glucoselysine PTS system EIIA component
MIRKFLIATHGAFAGGILSSLELIAGLPENVFVLQAYLDGNRSIEEELGKIIDPGNQEEEWIVFSDLLGGSITNQLLRQFLGGPPAMGNLPAVGSPPVVGGSPVAAGAPVVASAPAAANEHIHIVAGFNLALLIEIVLADVNIPAAEVIESAIGKAREQMVYVNPLVKPATAC